MHDSVGYIRADIKLNKPGENFIDQLSNSTPKQWRAMTLRVAFGLFDGADVDPIAELQTVTVEIRDNANRVRPPFASASTSTFDSTLDAASWADKSKAHGYVDFSASDMSLDLGGGNTQKAFWMVVHALLTDGARKVLGGTLLTLVESGVNVGVNTPAQGANLVPPGAVYDGSGEYELTVQMDKDHSVEFGDNDTDLVNDTQTITADDTFTTLDTVVTLRGTPGAAVTTIIRYPIFMTADETRAWIEKANRALTPGRAIRIMDQDSEVLYNLVVKDGNLFAQPVVLT